MRDFKMQVLRDVEVIISLIDLDKASRLSEKDKNKHQMEKILDMLKENYDNIDLDIANRFKCLNLQIKVNMFLRYVLIHIQHHCFTKTALNFISSNDLEVRDFMMKVPTVRLKEFYEILSNIDEQSMNETLALVDSSNPSILSEDLYSAIQAKDFLSFKQFISERNADISKAGRYLNLIQGLKQLASADRLRSVVENLEDDFFKNLLPQKLVDDIDYVFKFDTDNNCNEWEDLESRARNIFSFYKSVRDVYGTNLNIDKDTKEIIDLCCEGILLISIPYEELEEMFLSIFVNILPLVNSVPSSHIGIETTTTTFADIPKDYPERLRERKRITNDLSIKVLIEDLIKSKLEGDPDIDCIKYVFFGSGRKPKEKLEWKSTKKEFVALISYLCKNNAGDEVWDYFNQNINHKGEPIFKNTGNPSGTAGSDDKKKYLNKVQRIFNEHYNYKIPDTIYKDILDIKES